MGIVRVVSYDRLSVHDGPSGRWTVVRGEYQNCGSSACRMGCWDTETETKTAHRPHGPYTVIRRRNPDNPRQLQGIRLGRISVSDEDIVQLNADPIVTSTVELKVIKERIVKLLAARKGDEAEMRKLYERTYPN